MGERIGRIATCVLAGTVLGLGLDIGPKPADAQTPTPTATPISTPTPDKEIISKQATVTVLNEQLGRARKLAELRATEIAIRDAINAALGTPMPTATFLPSSTPNPDVIVIPRKEFNELIDKGVKIGVAAELANRDKQSTPVPARPAPGQTGKTQKEHDPTPGPDIGGLVPLALGAGGIAVGLWQRRRIWGWIRRIIH